MRLAPSLAFSPATKTVLCSAATAQLSRDRDFTPAQQVSAQSRRAMLDESTHDEATFPGRSVGYHLHTDHCASRVCSSAVPSQSASVSAGRICGGRTVGVSGGLLSAVSQSASAFLSQPKSWWPQRRPLRAVAGQAEVVVVGWMACPWVLQPAEVAAVAQTAAIGRSGTGRSCGGCGAGGSADGRPSAHSRACP